MTKQTTPTDTMQELWMIKDETAVRFQTVAAYFEHLGLSAQHQPRKVKSAPKEVSRSKRPKVLQAH